MKLFLSGGGSREKSIELDKLFALAVGRTKPILYLPTARNKDKPLYSGCLEWINGVFNRLGLNKIELWTEEDLKKRPESDLKRFGGVFIGGGSTYYLLKELREAGFIPKLERMIQKDIPVYGGSAGAIILGKSILASYDENFVNLKNLSGLNLIKGMSIFCHYDVPIGKNYAESLLKINKIGKSIALREDSGLYVSDKEIKVIGPGRAYLFDNKIKEIKPGEFV